MVITEFSKELEEFRNSMHTLKLGGIWKGVEITEKDIIETRRSLLGKLDEKWPMSEDTAKTLKNP